MKYPSQKMTLPKELRNVENGKLPKGMLSKIAAKGEMWRWAALCFNLMYKDAKKAGIKLKNIGDYRTFERQLEMFNDRYDLVDRGRKPKITRKYQGKTWYLKPGKSPSGTPGTSNHGLGLAIDLDVKDGKTLAWLCENAPRYGFFLQTDDASSPEFEAWHWQYSTGDKLPEVVLKAVQAFAEASKKKP